MVLHKKATMEDSIDSIVSHYYQDAQQHFWENYSDSEVIYDCFVCRLKKHILYHLIILWCRNDEKKINQEILDLYSMTKMIVESN
jgi:hypothetical protein